MSAPLDPTEVRAAIARIEQFARARDWRGPDPYDGLAGWAAHVPLPGRLRQAVIQANRRSPLNLRPLLGVKPQRMAKALALFASGYHRAPWLPGGQQTASALLADLADARGEDGAWGYEFDVQTRWGGYPASSLNIIATAFVVEAYCDLGAQQQILTVGEWLVSRLVDERGFVRYVPNSDRLVHNANMLGARCIHRLVPGHPAIEASLATTIEAQASDGTWPYGEGPSLSWTDNFHTVYILLALADLEPAYPWVTPALERGVAAWAASCFSADGGTRYYAHRDSRRADIHNLATAVHGLDRFRALHPECARLLPGALRALLSYQRRDGSFAVGRGPAFLRWNAAHAFRALTEVSAHVGEPPLAQEAPLVHHPTGMVDG